MDTPGDRMLDGLGRTLTLWRRPLISRGQGRLQGPESWVTGPALAGFPSEQNVLAGVGRKRPGLAQGDQDILLTSPFRW